jgi:predicted nucleotide-binding protein
MANKFYGTIEELKALVKAAGVHGTWSDGGNDCHDFKTKAGGLLKWWPTTHTYTFQGPGSAKATLESSLRPILEGGALPEASADSQDGRRIFVVHGHDTTAREQLELVLHRMGLEPFVLANTSGQGQTLIEALEGEIGKEARASFGIVLLTPDDRGYAKSAGEKEARDRARQNVILEMGMLFSSLTRKRVAILVKGDVEFPSDIAGLIRIHFNDHVKDTVPKLAEHLRTSGFDIPQGKLTAAMA